MLQLNPNVVAQSKGCFYLKSMRSLLQFVFVFGLGVGPFLTLHAQKRKSVEQTIISFKSEMTIDGNLDEWGDSLHYFFEKQNLQYEIANDEHHVYIAMQVRDGAWQMQALNQGFNFTINIDGKRKDGATITFPLPDRESLKALAAKDKDERPADIRQGILGAVRGIYVKGMVDVVDGLISLNNHYGIKAAVAIDSTDAVCYEAAIPLERLGLQSADEKEMAFNIKINGIVIRTVGGGRSLNRYGYGSYGYGYPYGYYGDEPMRKEARQEPGMWIILKLASPPKLK